MNRSLAQEGGHPDDHNPFSQILLFQPMHGTPQIAGQDLAAKSLNAVMQFNPGQSVMFVFLDHTASFQPLVARPTLSGVGARPWGSEAWNSDSGSGTG